MTDDPQLSLELLENVYAALQAEEVAAIRRAHVGEALARLLELAQTTPDPKLRAKAAARLGQLVREACLDISNGALKSKAIG